MQFGHFVQSALCPLPAPCVGLVSFPASEGSRFPVRDLWRILWASTGLLLRLSAVQANTHKKGFPVLAGPAAASCVGSGASCDLFHAVTVAGHRFMAFMVFMAFLLSCCCPVVVLLLSWCCR